MAGKIGAALFTMVLILVAATALAQVAPFGEMDLDQDGYLSKREFMAGQPGAQEHIFGMADMDGDGKLSFPEWDMSRGMIEMSVNPGMHYPTPDPYTDSYGGDPMKWGTPGPGDAKQGQPESDGQYREAVPSYPGQESGGGYSGRGY